MYAPMAIASLDVIETEVMVLTPVEKSFYSARVCHPGVAVADGRVKEFDMKRGG
jgi:hypothetical protein